MKTTSLMLLLMAGLTACTTLSELREQEPSKQASFTGSYRTMALCTFDGLENKKVRVGGWAFDNEIDGVYRIIDRPPSQADVFAGMRGPQSPLFELIFKQITPDTVAVDMRVIHARHVSDVWPLIERCAQATSAKSP